MQPLASEGDHAICAMPCGHVIGKSCGIQLLTKSKKCPYCNRPAGAKSLRRLFLPGSLLSPPSQDLQLENENLKKRLRELENQIEPLQVRRKIEQPTARNFQVSPSPLIAKKSGSFARCGVFDDAGNFFFCSTEEPSSVQVYDSAFRVYATLPQAADCKNLEISRAGLLGWGTTGAFLISPGLEIVNFPGNFDPASLLFDSDLIDNIAKKRAENHQRQTLGSPDTPHTIFRVAENILCISRCSILRINPSGASVPFVENEIPKNSVSAARVRGPGNFFILSYRDPEPHLLIFEFLGESAKLACKISGFQNSFLRAKPAACHVSDMSTWKFIVAMIDEKSGFNVWRVGERVMEPTKFSSDHFVSHFDFFIGRNTVKLAAVSVKEVSIFELSLD